MNNFVTIGGNKMKKIIVCIFAALISISTHIDVVYAGAATMTNKGTNPAAKATEQQAKAEATTNKEKKAAQQNNPNASDSKKKIDTKDAYNKAVNERNEIKKKNIEENKKNEAANKAATGKEEETKEETNKEDKDTDTSKDKANATLEAASMASMGLGAMEAAQALSEKKSDAAAETDMTAYLATMRCEWGKGGTSKLSTEDIDVGAGNELINYASEYKTLAARLKKTKSALNLTPGIESEEILDKASAGLYEYTPAERSSGAYASLSKALRDENSIDAQKWAEQKDTTKKRLIAGAAVAGAGLVASVVGNQIINKDGNRKTASTAENIATLTDNNYFKEYLDE